MNKKRLSALMLTSALISVGAQADTFKLDAPIEKVTVYRNGGALITRTGTLNAPAGKHSFILNKLPDEVDGRFTPFVNVTNGNAKVARVKISPEYSTEKTSEEQLKIQAQIEKLTKQVAASQDTIQAKNLQLNFLRSISSGTRKSDNSLNIDNIEQAFDFVGEKSATVLKEMQQEKAVI